MICWVSNQVMVRTVIWLLNVFQQQPGGGEEDISVIKCV